MIRFSNMKRKEEKEREKELFKSKNIDIVSYDDNNFIKSSYDRIALLPYIKDDGYILLIYENVPAYHYKYKDVENYRNILNFLSIIKGEIKNETPVLAVRRTLIENTGIVLRANYPITIDKKLFLSDKETTQYFISLLEINYNDYQQGPLKQKQEDNRVIKLNIGEIDNIKTFDVLTDYMLLKLKYDYKL